ncbi:MAG TPA: hypothetical protein PLZ95_00735 [Bryobacteraceae bacterium]|nr:hypothetical protein [Bryobacteraceae bacterium]
MEPETEPQAPAVDPIRMQQELAHDQIAAAWQLHTEQVQERLETGWRDHIERVLTDRLEAVSAAARGEVERLVSERLSEEIERQRAHILRAVTERLNQSVRRIEQAEDSTQWTDALLDGAHGFAANVALFSTLGGELKHEGHRFAPTSEIPLTSLDGFRIPISEVPAAGSLGESLDTVISMATAAELSEPLAAALDAGGGRRICLIPVVAGRATGDKRAAAILMAWDGGDPLDVNVLELLCAFAGASLDAAFDHRQPSSPGGKVVNIIPIQPVLSPAAAAPPLAEMSRDEQELHSKAQRFARVRVAEMRLYQPEQVRRGREQSNLYVALRGEMDRSRAQFKHEFMLTDSMVDYFHLEIVRTLANDDESLLGPEYPGPIC